MSNIKKHLKSDIKAKKDAKIGIAVSEYNPKISSKLLETCQKELVNRGVLSKNIKVVKVPGAFELPFVCQKLAKSKKYNAVIALGAIIQGETPHFDFIAFASSHGIMEVGLKYGIPVVFGVLTTDNLSQAKARVKGGKHGDKGIEAALTALKLINLN